MASLVTAVFSQRAGNGIRDQLRELLLDFMDFPQFGKGPAAEMAQAVDAGNPVAVHSGLFSLASSPRRPLISWSCPY